MRRWLFISIATYGVSLFLPAVHGGEHSLDGLVVLILGIFAEGCSAWYANLIYAASLAMLASKKYKPAIVFSLAAALVGLDTFRLESFQIDSAGYNVAVTSIGLAFYVWTLSFLLVALGAHIVSRRDTLETLEK